MFSSLKKIPRFFFNLLQIKESALIGISEPNLFITVMFLLLGKKNLKIYFPYDITFFRYHDYKRNFWYNYLPESFNFRFADAILHKGPEDELAYLPSSFSVSSKPHMQFLPYCNKQRMIDIKNNEIEKISSTKTGIHLVYVGGVIHNHQFDYSFIDTFKKIVDQKVFLHVYPTNYSDLINDAEFQNLCNNEFFILHKPVFGTDLQRELSKYDWGIYIIYYNFDVRKQLWATTMFGNKVSDYLEAGIPIVANSDMTFVSTLLNAYQFGIVVNQPEEIKSEISKINYQKFIEQLDHNRYKLTFEENIGKLEGFIHSLNKVRLT